MLDMLSSQCFFPCGLCIGTLLLKRSDLFPQILPPRLELARSCLSVYFSFLLLKLELCDALCLAFGTSVPPLKTPLNS